MSGTLLTVIFPVILGAVVIALMNIVKRKIMKDGAISPLQCLILHFASATMAFGTVYVFFWGFTLPKMLPGVWTAAICWDVANIFIQFFNMKAASIDKGEVSLTAPLQAMTPGLITGLAVLLGEYPSKIGIMGIVLMSAGSYVLLWEKTPNRWYEYFGPIRRILLLVKFKRLNQAERNKTIVVILALGSACMGTFGLLFDGLYARRALTMQGIILVSMVLVAILCSAYVIWFCIRPDAKPTQKFYGHLQRTVLIPIFAMGILWTLQIIAIQPTYTKTFVAYIGTLKRFSIIISVILGFLFFKEKDFKKRIWAAILIVAGVMLIATDNLPARISVKIEKIGL